MSGHSDFSVLSRHGEETFVSLLSLSKLPVLPEVDVESARFPAKSESWNKTPTTMLNRVFHMTMLSVIVCVMNVRNQTSQASVTRS